MQRRKHKIYCLILAICFIASCICLDNYKADSLMCVSHTMNESSPVINAGYRVSNEDACTSEMMGNIHNSLLTYRSARYNSEEQSRTGTLLGILHCSCAFQKAFCYFTSVTADISPVSSNAAEIILFIHSKDGKK